MDLLNNYDLWERPGANGKTLKERFSDPLFKWQEADARIGENFKGFNGKDVPHPLTAEVRAQLFF